MRYLVGGNFVVDTMEEANEIARDYEEMFGIIVGIEEI